MAALTAEEQSELHRALRQESDEELAGTLAEMSSSTSWVTLNAIEAQVLATALLELEAAGVIPSVAI